MLKIHPGRWLTPLGFEFGSFGPLWVREETFDWECKPCSLLYASDLHLGCPWTSTVPEQITAAVQELRPEVLLLGGDLVDVAAGLRSFQRFISEIASLTVVAAIPGNHDGPKVQEALRAGGGHWLPDEPLRTPLAIDGTIQQRYARADILCAHFPSDFPRAADAGYRLVLAGHLHGGQCVLAQVGSRLYPGAWFQRWHGLRFEAGNSTLLVSRGVGDTLPCRFRCPRELLLCRFV